MRIIEKRASGVSVSFEHNYGQANAKGAIELSYGFPCDAMGVILPLQYEAARANLAKCIAGLDGIVSMGVREYRHTFTLPAIGECECKAHVVLSGFTNTCDCGADYNMSGQRLADRAQWGEETGETASDILNYERE
jgi:hypothetical protein